MNVRLMNARSLMVMLIVLLFCLSACGPAHHGATWTEQAAVAGHETEPPTSTPGQPAPQPAPQTQPAPAQPAPQPPTVPASDDSQRSSVARRPAAWDGVTPRAAFYTSLLEQSIITTGSKLLFDVPNDINDFCPRYSKLNAGERVNFWLMLVSSMAKYESDFNPLSAHREKFRNSENEFVVSRGLLQLSRESSNDLGCHITRETDLEDPGKNLDCGVRILTHYVTEDGAIVAHQQHWHGGAAYWNVFRLPETKASIAYRTRHNTPGCME